VNRAVRKSRKNSGERVSKKFVPSTAYTEDRMSKMKKALHTGSTVEIAIDTDRQANRQEGQPDRQTRTQSQTQNHSTVSQ